MMSNDGKATPQRRVVAVRRPVPPWLNGDSPRLDGDASSLDIEAARFLLGLDDALRRVEGADAVWLDAARALATFLGISEARFFEAGSGAHLRTTDRVQGATTGVRLMRLDEFGDVVSDAIRADRPFVATDVATDDRLGATERRADTLGSGAFVALPLVTHGALTAVLVLRHATPRVWSPTELAVAQQTVRRAWAAAERVRDDVVLRERSALLAGQKEAFAAAVARAPLTVSLGILVRTALDVRGPNLRCAFYLADEEGSELHLVAGMSDQYAACVDGFKIGPDSIACGLAVASNRPVITPDVNLDVAWEPWRWMAAEYGYRGVWSFPIESEDGKAIGTLAMYYGEPREPSAGDLEFVDVLTQAAGVIISGHHDARDRTRAEMALRDRLAWLAGQKDAFAAAVNGAPLDAALGILVRTALMHDDPRPDRNRRCAFYMADDAGETLHHVTGMPAPYALCVDGFEIGADSLACGLAVHTGRPVITADVRDEPRWEPWLWLARENDYRAVWSFPVETSTGLVVGTFAMYFAEPREALPRDYEFAAVLTQAAAIIIARYREAAERERAEAALRESRARYRMLVDNVAVYAIVLLDERGVVCEWTAGAQQMFGYVADEATGMPATALFAPGDVAAFGVDLQRAADSGRTERESHRIRKNGETFWANDVLTAVYDHDERVVGFSSVTRDLTEPRRAAEALERQRAAAERDALRLRLLAAEEEERRRLSRELHDEAGQHLTLLGLGVQRLSTALEPGSEAERRAVVLADLVNTLGRDLHALATRLRPRVLDDFGFAAALELYVDDWSRRSQIPVDVQSRLDRRLAPEIESALYRIVQEALTNVGRHAAARNVGIVIERRDGHVNMTVEDDGHGFDGARAAGANAGSLGLLGIRERVELFGGSVEVESSADAGTTLFVRLPLNDETDPRA